eukprot:6229149-Amphidinium_carterae.1
MQPRAIQLAMDQLGRSVARLKAIRTFVFFTCVCERANAQTRIVCHVVDTPLCRSMLIWHCSKVTNCHSALLYHGSRPTEEV